MVSSGVNIGFRKVCAELLSGANFTSYETAGGLLHELSRVGPSVVRLRGVRKCCLGVRLLFGCVQRRGVDMI